MSGFDHEKLRDELLGRRDEIKREMEGIEADIDRLEHLLQTRLAAWNEVATIIDRITDLDPDFDEVRAAGPTWAIGRPETLTIHQVDHGVLATGQKIVGEGLPEGSTVVVPKTRAPKRPIRQMVLEHMQKAAPRGVSVGVIAITLDTTEASVIKAVEYWRGKNRLTMRDGYVVLVGSTIPAAAQASTERTEDRRTGQVWKGDGDCPTRRTTDDWTAARTEPGEETAATRAHTRE